MCDLCGYNDCPNPDDCREVRRELDLEAALDISPEDCFAELAATAADDEFPF